MTSWQQGQHAFDSVKHSMKCTSAGCWSYQLSHKIVGKSMKNRCRKQAKTQLEFDHDFEAKMVPKIVENRAKIDPKSMKKGSRYTVTCKEASRWPKNREKERSRELWGSLAEASWSPGAAVGPILTCHGKNLGGRRSGTRRLILSEKLEKNRENRSFTRAPPPWLSVLDGFFQCRGRGDN